MSTLALEELQLGMRVRRMPAGRWCSIVAVDADAGKIKIRVVAGVYTNRATRTLPQEVLVGQRSEKMQYPFTWECPGGKVEEGESDLDALRREWLEEMTVIIKQIEPEPLSEFVGVDPNGQPFRVVAYRVISFEGWPVVSEMHTKIEFLPVQAFARGAISATPAMPSIIEALLKPAKEKAKHAAALIEEMERWKRKIEADDMRTNREVQFYNRIGNEAIYSNLPLILEGLRLVIDMETPSE